MKVINPLGRTPENIDNNDVVAPRGCVCTNVANNFTSIRKMAGNCKRCFASCKDNKGTNYYANGKLATKKGSY